MPALQKMGRAGETVLQKLLSKGKSTEKAERPYRGKRKSSLQGEAREAKGGRNLRVLWKAASNTGHYFVLDVPREKQGDERDVPSAEEDQEGGRT